MHPLENQKHAWPFEAFDEPLTPSFAGIEHEAWVPYVADDVQMDFKMLDPYYRLTLDHEIDQEGRSVYSTSLQVPITPLPAQPLTPPSN